MSWHDGRVDLSGSAPVRRRPALGGILLLGLILAIGGAVGSVIGTLTGVAVGSETLGVIVRSVLVALLVCLTTQVACRRDGHGLGRSAAWGAGVVAYLVAPTSWVGETMMATGFGLEGLAAAFVDLLPWLGCVGLGVIAASPAPGLSGDRVVDSLLRR